MRKVLGSILALVLLAGAVAVARSAAVTKPPAKTVVIAFVGSYSGQASVQQADATATISATGSGKGTLLGAGTLTGKGSSNVPSQDQPCAVFSGAGKLTGPGGTLAYNVVPGSNGCGDESGSNFVVTAHFKVMKGTGKLLKALGTLKVTGTYNHSDGSFQVKVAGKLTQKK